MSMFESKGGVFVVRYDAPEDLTPERQKTLEVSLRQASLQQPVGIVFVVGPNVRMVDPAVPAYWLGVTGDPLIRIAAMAIVTTQAAVSIATRGFSVASTLKDRPLRVKPFPDETAALAWVADVMSGKAA